VLAAFNKLAGKQNLPCKKAAAMADRYPHEPSIVVALLFVYWRNRPIHRKTIF
jgi:hypothetical protein